MSPRDTQRSRLYEAEDVASWRVSQYRWKQTITNGGLQPFVDKVMAKGAVRGRFGHRRIVVDLGRGGGLGGGGSISLGVKARNPWIICHEIAHCLTPERYADHGPEFAGIMLFLVRNVIGAEAAATLRATYREKRVRVSNAAIPAYDRSRIEQVKVREAERRAAASAPPSPEALARAAAVVRRAARAGMLGEATRKPRVHALATARLLEGLAK